MAPRYRASAGQYTAGLRRIRHCTVRPFVRIAIIPAIVIIAADVVAEQLRQQADRSPFFHCNQVARLTVDLAIGARLLGICPVNLCPYYFPGQ